MCVCVLKLCYFMMVGSLSSCCSVMLMLLLREIVVPGSVDAS